MGQIEKISEDTSKILGLSLRQSYIFWVCFKLFFLCLFVYFFSAIKGKFPLLLEDPLSPMRQSLGENKANVTSSGHTGVVWGLMK